MRGRSDIWSGGRHLRHSLWSWQGVVGFDEQVSARGPLTLEQHKLSLAQVEL